MIDKGVKIMVDFKDIRIEVKYMLHTQDRNNKEIRKPTGFANINSRISVLCSMVHIM